MQTRGTSRPRCSRTWPREEINARILGGDADPHCLTCGGLLKSRTISFGQPLPPQALEAAHDAASSCDLLLVVGSSLEVFPAAGLVPIARRSGARLIIVNLTPTRYDRLADLCVMGRAGVVLPSVLGAPARAPAQAASP